VQARHAHIVRPDQMLLVVVGNVPEQEFLAEIERRWPASAAGETAPYVREIPPALPPGGNGEALRLTKDIEQAFLVVGFSGPQIGTADNVALRVASGVLGEGMSARLFSRLRDRDHLAYAVGSSMVTRELGSLLALYIGTKPETAEVAREGMLREAASLYGEELSETELNRAKRYIIGKYLVSRQTNLALATSMSAYELMGLGWEWGEHLPERVHAVSAADVQDVSRRYLINPTATILQPEG
jgi:zinc protease